MCTKRGGGTVKTRLLIHARGWSRRRKERPRTGDKIQPTEDRGLRSQLEVELGAVGSIFELLLRNDSQLKFSSAGQWSLVDELVNGLAAAAGVASHHRVGRRRKHRRVRQQPVERAIGLGQSLGDDDPARLALLPARLGNGPSAGVVGSTGNLQTSLRLSRGDRPRAGMARLVEAEAAFDLRLASRRQPIEGLDLEHRQRLSIYPQRIYDA